ncbi:hypothetical protein KKI24_21650 [bacterium]|nr:hypothetical protein [bacterium]
MGQLLELRKEAGDKVVEVYRKGKLLPKEEIFGLPVDMLIPGVRPYVINKDNVNQIKARVISTSANIPITDEAEEALFKKGTIVVPDFISNAGGTIVALIDAMKGSADDVFKTSQHCHSQCHAGHAGRSGAGSCEPQEVCNIRGGEDGSEKW